MAQVYRTYALPMDTLKKNLLVIDPLRLSGAELQACSDSLAESETRLASPSSISYMLLETKFDAIVLHESLDEAQIHQIMYVCSTIEPDIPILSE